jgi:hypothetical protein
MAKSGKLPKRIAGVKIPKKLRKQGGKLHALLDQPFVADVVAAGLLAAADAMVRSRPARKAGKAAKHAAADASEAAAEAASTGAVNIGSVLAFAAREAARAIKSNSGR